MDNLNPSEIMYIITAFLFQAVLIAHFAMRKWRFVQAIRNGWIVYGLSIPAAVVSISIATHGEPWYYWISGLLYLIWAIYGYSTEYIKKSEWRDPVRWSVLVPYISLYLATVMLYWWPLAAIYKPLWYLGALLFIVSTCLNITSHKRGESLDPKKYEQIRDIRMGGLS